MAELKGYNKARNYARCMRGPWGWRHMAADLGLPRRTVMRQMKRLRDEGEIVQVGRPQKGLYLHLNMVGKAQQEKVYKQMAAKAAQELAELEERTRQQLQQVLDVMEPRERYTTEALRDLSGVQELSYGMMRILEERNAVRFLRLKSGHYWYKWGK
jgi:predicted ArsR family transcriptional regulator